MGDADGSSLTSADNGTLASPPNDEQLDDLLPRLRLNAESIPVAGETPPVRPRSNASDYATNPKSPKMSIRKIDNYSDSSLDSSIENGGVPSSLALSPRTNLLTNSLNASSLSINEEKVVVEDNDDIIHVSPGSLQKPFSPETSSETDDNSEEVGTNGVQASFSAEPEPGAAIEPVVRIGSVDLPLISPGESDDEAGESRSTAPPEDLSMESWECEIKEYSPEWYTSQKHVFIFSEAGKPIYSRYGKEENIVGLFGVMQAIMSCVQDNHDDIQCIRTLDRVFVFRCHPPLVLAAVAHPGESEEQISRQLKYVTNQAIFFLTQSHMARLFKNRQSYDLRRQLTGLPKFFKGIIDFVEEEVSFLVESFRCLPMPQSLRNEIANIILTNRCPELVFALVLYERQIISVVRPKQYVITPQDLHLLMNYVQTGSTRGHGEKWAPCCLPDFNDGGYLYVHDAYISDTLDISLVLITNEREQHLTMIECKQQIVEQMLAQKTLDKLETVLATPFVCADTKIPHLRHFIYKSRSSHQIVSPEYTAPYNSDEDRKHLHAKYCHVYDKLHQPDHKLTIYYDIDGRESMVGYLMNNAAIYCTFSPFITRPVALNNIDKLLKWIRKEENRFFILGSGVY